MNTRNLALIIVLSSLLPAIAVIWSRMDQRDDQAARAELAAALNYDHNSPHPHDCAEWLARHGSHPLAPMVRRMLNPDNITRLKGVSVIKDSLAAELGMRDDVLK